MMPEGHDRQIIVLGMHRSGTSAATGLLQACGVYVGSSEDLTKPGTENPRGFFERRDLRGICDSLLRAAGADWWKVSEFEVDRIPPQSIIEQTRPIQRLVAHLDGEGTWAIKDPRLCLLFPVFRRFVKNPIAVIVIRHPIEVAQSLRHRNGFPLVAGLSLWEAYVAAALRNSADIPRVFLSYEALIRSPEETTRLFRQQLNQLSGLNLKVTDPAKIVDPALHRERVTTDTLEVLLSPGQRELWAALSHGEPHLPDLSLSDFARLVLRDFEVDRTAALRGLDALSETVRRSVASAKVSSAHARRLRGDIHRLRSALTDSRRKAAAEAMALRKELDLTRVQADLRGRVSEVLSNILHRHWQTLRRDSPQMSAEISSLVPDDRFDFRIGKSRLPQRFRLRLLNRPSRSDPSRSTGLSYAMELVANSGLFDREWYLKRYEDVRGSAADPLEHYLQFGGFEGRDPSPKFSSAWYLSRYPDVKAMALNPLIHYILYGKIEKRDPVSPHASKGPPSGR